MIVSAFLLAFVTLSACEDSVKFVAVIYRHGDRTPVGTYPTDPWRNESLWPVKFGELTNIGKRQHYALGQWLRKRYGGLISPEFDPSEIYVRSTDVDRTLMSAQANLAGMYPPTNKSMWDTNLMWQPIPVHTVPEKDDEILAMKKHCETYNKEKEALIRSKEYKKRLSKYQGLMDYLVAYTGQKIKDYTDINYIYNILYIEKLYNFTLPNWTNSVYPMKMKEPACYSFTLDTATPLMARLKVGPLLKQIVSHMVNATKSVYCKKSKSLKMSMYSGHDETIGNILCALKVFNGECPCYTSTILLELIQVSENTTQPYYIRILYRNSTEIVEPYVLYIPYCGRKCPLDRFIQLYDNLLTVNWEYECGKQLPPLLGIAFYMGLSIFLAIYIIHRVFVFKTFRPQRIYTYSNVNNAAASKNTEGVF